MSLNLSGNTITLTGTSTNGDLNKRVTREGLVLELDAGDLNSYPGAGSTWYDLSGFQHNFTHGANIAWNSAGYFDCTGGEFSGPASNASTWGFQPNCENTIEIYCEMTAFQSNKTFWWESAGSLRAIASHLGYGASGLSYYDVGGGSGATQRISGLIPGLTGEISCITYHNRSVTYPSRRIYKNLVQTIDSGTNGWCPNVTWSDPTPVLLFSSWLGYAYIIRVYNRPLHPYEMAENFQATRGRFGI